jgi:uncharacterized membrane protein YqjE
MGDNPPPPAGILESLRKLGHTGVAVVQNRIQLLSVELEEQKVRLVKLLLLAGATIFMANTALLAISVTIVVLAGERGRVPVLLGLTLIYVSAAVWAFLMLRKEIKSAPPPFHDTVSELKKDGEWLHPRN